MKRTVIQAIVALLVVGGGAGAAFKMISSADKAERAPAREEAPLVEVVAVEQVSPNAVITGTGVIEAARQSTLAPEVGGRLTYVSPKLVTGGRLQQGETIVRIDPRDYQLALRERRSQVKQAELELELERGRGAVAQREWELLTKNDADRPKSSLALREPQLEAAQVAVESAEAAVARARRDLEKTVIRAPFNAAVSSEQVEKGELVSPGSTIATLIGTDEFWAEIALPVEQLGLIRIPGFGSTDGSSAELVQELGAGRTIVREGHVIRIAKELDRESRTATVIIAVQNPLDPPGDALPLLPGAFVTARIEGKKLEGALAIPRVAVVQGNRVWVADENDRMRSRDLQIVFSTHDTVYARSGIEPGERVIVSRLPMTVEGMLVRTKSAAKTDAIEAGNAEASETALQSAGHVLVTEEQKRSSRVKG